MIRVQRDGACISLGQLRVGSRYLLSDGVADDPPFYASDLAVAWRLSDGRAELVSLGPRLDAYPAVFRDAGTLGSALDLVAPGETRQLPPTDAPLAERPDHRAILLIVGLLAMPLGWRLSRRAPPT